jgi:hypothetical protein
MNPVQAAMLQMGGFVGATSPAGQPAGGGAVMAPGFAQFGIVPLAQLQGGAQGGVQAVPLAGLTLLTPQVGCWIWPLGTVTLGAFRVGQLLTTR